jgi:hypothetical protein
MQQPQAGVDGLWQAQPHTVTWITGSFLHMKLGLRWRCREVRRLQLCAVAQAACLGAAHAHLESLASLTRVQLYGLGVRTARASVAALAALPALVSLKRAAIDFSDAADQQAEALCAGRMACASLTHLDVKLHEDPSLRS